MKKIILQPKYIKFKKQQKGVLAPIEWTYIATTLSFGLYGIKVLKSSRLSLKQLETIRRQISKYLRNYETLIFRIRPDIPVTKKPNEIRMGKGKGSLNFWACKIKAGQILVEFQLLSLKKAQKIFIAVAKKLPIPSILVINQNKIFS